jgi:Protein of unknown function (DUF1566)
MKQYPILALTVLAVLIAACSKPEKKEETKPEVGGRYQGGIVVYLLQPGDAGYDPQTAHGFIVAESNGYAPWGCQSVKINNTSINIGTGKTNTTSIVNGCTEAGIAAKLCDELVLNGYTDWYLPSREELRFMITNKNSIPNIDTTTVYWSSSEENSNYSYSLAHNVQPGNSIIWMKSFTKAYRAFRSF